MNDVKVLEVAGAGDTFLACAYGACECDGSMVHGPKSEVDCSFNFGAPCFFTGTLQSSTRGTPVVAPAFGNMPTSTLNVRILSHHHGNINSHSQEVWLK